MPIVRMISGREILSGCTGYRYDRLRRSRAHLNAGFKAFLSKPFSPETLAETILTALND
jgi:CheY-like chemotaxis protein